MSRPDYIIKVKERIGELEPGSVFCVSDFADIADPKTIHMCLKRLTDKGVIKKVMRGVYQKVRFSSLIHEDIPARPDDIAGAIARNNGWTIVPSDEVALNLMGLSAQVPAKWQYISDGPYKEYRTEGGVDIIFKHTNKNTELTQVSYRTALLIRAIKAMGKDEVSETEVSLLSQRIMTSEKDQILQEAKYCTSWVYDIIKQICGKEINE